jgi:hypothetical protein
MNWFNIRITVTLALVWAAAVVVPAQAGDWTTDLSFGCRLWNPHPQGNETIRWTGSCANGFAQGHGAAQWFRDNLPFETDEGEWWEGRQVGYGTQVWPSGRYEGELHDGEPHGRGVLVSQKVRYEGEFRNGKPHGLGALTNGTDVIYGTWTDGCFRNGTRRASFGVPLSTCP